jgi:uncharacterized protein YjbI with pentapeptide repeats
MSLRRCLAVASIAALGHVPALAEELPRIAPHDAYAAIERGGELRRLQIDGDLDVARMVPPPGAKRILMQEVRLEGTLRSSAGGPAVALEIGRSHLRDVDLRGTRWTAPLTIEGSTIKDRAWFEEAQLDAPFVLHGSALTGQVLFRRARFAAPVEITSSQFRPAEPLRAGANFADARFAAPARFDRSELAAGVRFDTARFDADASFLGLAAAGRASWRNVIFGGDAEFRFCRLGDADFGDIEQMSVFMQLADFRGCTMNSLRLDYADMRGDTLLVDVQIAPGDLSLRQASLRGARNDFSGLKVAGKLDLTGARIANLQLQWSEIAPALMRGAPGSDVLRPLQQRLEELGRDDEARAAAAALADVRIEERLAQAETSLAGKALLWVERIVWGGATGYGTRLERIVGVAMLCWLVLALPLVLAPGMRIAPMRAGADKAPPLHQAVPPEALRPPPASAMARGFQGLSYAFALMFALPDLGLRPAEPVSAAWQGYLLFMRAAGVTLIALAALTLANVSPIIQAVLGKIVG